MTKTFDEQVAEAREWFQRPRFKEIKRLYSPRAVAEQKGTIEADYPIARKNAEEFYELLRELYAKGEQITTFGPYSPGQAVTMKRVGIKGIYLGGWATSAKGSVQEDPGPDLASYPLSQVPDEAAVLVRALLTADKNQHFLRSRMTEEERAKTPAVDYRPFIIADADTGHGGDAHVRNLVRRFVEVGVTGYHIEDQKPGAKKCGHQGGKVLVTSEEQIKRLNAARLQLDVMGVAGLIVARTDAEAATLVETNSDERDQPFILGATNLDVPSYKSAYLAIQRRLNELGVEDALGYQLSALTDAQYEAADRWIEKTGFITRVEETAKKIIAAQGSPAIAEKLFDDLESRYAELWEEEAGLKTYAEAVLAIIEFRANQSEPTAMSADEWREFSKTASLATMRDKAKSLGIHVSWSDDLPRTPEGYYQVRGGIDYAIVKSLAAAPFCDIIWMETKTADYADAKEFADAIHAVYPEKMLAYNLSPSFNWDTTGMTDEEMRDFPKEIGKLGFVFNFITYGGHQVDGLAGEEFATALRDDGMLALARLQRKFRLLESPYRTPQTLVGGPRLDSALMSVSGRTAATKAMGAGSTQHQHLVQTEAPPAILAGWIGEWKKAQGVSADLRVDLRPHTAGSELLELGVYEGDKKILDVIFTTMQDRGGRQILSIRDQNTDPSYRRKRLMALAQLFLIHRYKATAIHYLTPTDDNAAQVESMKKIGLFEESNRETGLIIIAQVSAAKVAELVAEDGTALRALVAKK